MTDNDDSPWAWSDDDELLYTHTDGDTCVTPVSCAPVREALRAALAIRPELVQVGWFEDAEQAAISLRYHQSFPAPEPPFPEGVPIFVRQSDLSVDTVAGSATPTEDT